MVRGDHISDRAAALQTEAAGRNIDLEIVLLGHCLDAFFRLSADQRAVAQGARDGRFRDAADPGDVSYGLNGFLSHF